LPRRRLLLAVIVLPAGLDLSGRIETEQENDQNEDDRSYTHGFFESPAKNRRSYEAEQNTEQWT
jgi:hypothetical protein